ncbi:MAG: response regulator transcription factor [Thermoflexales bacterium]|nr:response regulator transcription factor [Thermoflexales bacterium]
MSDPEPRPEIRVLVVDDEASLADLIRTGLTYEGFEVSVAEDGVTALDLARTQRPHVVVLDWMMPGLDGIQVCRKLRAASDVSILMLTARGELEDRVAGLDAGADDYLVKPFRFQELLARINAMLRRRNLQLRKRLTVGDLSLDRETREAWRNDQPVTLTPREFGLLELLMSHPRQVFSREQMLNRVWGYDWVGDANVVEVHISSLRDKIGDPERQLIRTVRGVGYTLRG